MAQVLAYSAHPPVPDSEQTTYDSKSAEPAPEIRVRHARIADAPSVVQLLSILGYPSSVANVEQRMAACASSPDTIVLLAESATILAGVLSFHRIPLLHQDGYLGRITSLIVAPEHRRHGIGRQLVSAAEEYAWTHGCLRVEVTSGDHRTEAHVFYEQLGYQSDCRRFIKHRLPFP